eukprot:scaffold252745_cov28-Attheya_sp.AAC.1
MASAFKMAGRSKYYNLSLDYVDNMSFHLSLESLNHVRLSMHELLYLGKSDSGDYRHSRNHVNGFIEMCNDKQKKPESKTVLQIRMTILMRKQAAIVTIVIVKMPNW